MTTTKRNQSGRGGRVAKTNSFPSGRNRTFNGCNYLFDVYFHKPKDAFILLNNIITAMYTATDHSEIHVPSFKSYIKESLFHGPL